MSKVRSLAEIAIRLQQSEWVADYEDGLALEALDLSRPPCPTHFDNRPCICDDCEHSNAGPGKCATCGSWVKQTPCPENGGNCDGRMSLEWMTAIVALVFDRRLDVDDTDWASCMDDLRGVRAPK